MVWEKFSLDRFQVLSRQCSTLHRLVLPPSLRRRQTSLPLVVPSEDYSHGGKLVAPLSREGRKTGPNSRPVGVESQTVSSSNWQKVSLIYLSRQTRTCDTKRSLFGKSGLTPDMAEFPPVGCYIF